MLQQELHRVFLAEVARDMHGCPTVSGVLVDHIRMAAEKASEAVSVVPGGCAGQFFDGDLLQGKQVLDLAGVVDVMSRLIEETVGDGVGLRLPLVPLHRPGQRFIIHPFDARPYLH